MTTGDHLDPSTLFAFQQRVLASLHGGRSVILQAPTGAGKTRAAIFPFLLALRDGWTSFPRRCIYSVPMRVLANQFYEEYNNLSSSAFQNLSVSIQTGERPEDRYFEKPLIFTTIDQTLSSALGVPYGLSRGQGNLNVAAVFSSYLVFDEFHLFPRDGGLRTTLQLLKLFRGLTPFVLMTATFSGTMLNELAELLCANVVTVPEVELASIPSQQGKARRFHTVDSQLTPEAVLAKHHSRSIVICNVVERAQSLYRNLKNHPYRGNADTVLLHSRFLPEDRNSKEELVRREFGPDRSQRKTQSMILVATQVIEVGLNITCENLHTEIAPASSILQRAGRCARFSGERGDVYVYRTPLAEDGRYNYAPYTGGGEQECEMTWSAMEKRNGRPLNFCDEQQVIDEVHAESDRILLEEMKQQERAILYSISLAITQGETSERAQLIRRPDTRTILVNRNPDNLTDPYACSGFSFWHGSIRGKYADLTDWAKEKALPWVIKYPVDVDRSSEEGETGHLYEWREVQSIRDFDASPIFVIHPGLVDYDRDVGFRFTDEGGKYETGCRAPESSADPVARFAYSLESYEEHVMKMLAQYRRKLADLETGYPAKHLEQRLGLEEGLINRIVGLAIATHDTAKMNHRWQAWARAYQRLIGEPVETRGCFIAHTHYDANNATHEAALEAANKRAGCKRPPHAGEGAIAVARLVHEAVGGNQGLRRAVLTAIARHHSAQLREYSAYRLESGAADALARALTGAGFTDPNHLSSHLLTMPPSASLENHLLRPDDPFDWWLTYFLIVRVLRLADRMSQQSEPMEVLM